jgi:Domain of unknown function DUF1828
MSVLEITQTIQQAIGKQIEVEREGNDRYPIYTPFTMEDGDHFTIVLQGKEGSQEWVLTDEGSTLLHLSYIMDYASLKKGTRNQVIERVLGQFGLQNREGELRLITKYSDLASAIFTFLQALTRVTDITYLSREQAKATFLDDFREFMQTHVPAERLTFDYNHPQFDRQRIYTVDALVNHSSEPLYVFAVGGNDRCRDVTINLHQYRSWKIPFQSMAVFQDQKEIQRDVLARFSDIADKQFSSLTSSETQISEYLTRHLSRVSS